ncbi:hypothetical protein [uncultured Sphingomonas sp.]|uniref:hypothetical protein n=1 Tax=uncultured Sphingomonas sp. TaxID=158754 RepID=UPI00262232C6|nr:hypothetical protein [uncultured Sphingomonas sp.]
MIAIVRSAPLRASISMPVDQPLAPVEILNVDRVSINAVRAGWLHLCAIRTQSITRHGTTGLLSRGSNRRIGLA